MARMPHPSRSGFERLQRPLSFVVAARSNALYGCVRERHVLGPCRYLVEASGASLTQGSPMPSLCVQPSDSIQSQ